MTVSTITLLRKILFIVNPNSGTQKEDVLQVIKDHHVMYSDVEVKYLFPHWETFHQQLDELYLEFSFDTIVACGGDGTVRAIAEYVYGKEIKLGIIPVGSSNGLAKNLNIPIDVKGALYKIFNGEQTKKLASVMINGHFSIHLADAGLNANIVKRFEKGVRRGFLGYIIAGLKVLRDYDFFKVQIKNKNTLYYFKSCMVVIANANMYGTGFVINHIGDLSDLEFEVVVVKNLSLKGFFKMSMNDWVPDPELIHIIQTKQIEIESHTPLSVQVDGEYIGKYKKISAQINPQLIDIIV